MRKKHALVIGGTGMLSDVTIWLNKKGYHVTVIGRRNETYQRLMSKVKFPKSITSLLVDYHDTDMLKELLLERIEKDGPIEVVVSWVHSSAPEVNPTVLALLDSFTKDNYHFFHVKSSTSSIHKQKPKVPVSGHYYEIYLGFKIIGNHSRWLTHQEISQGVIDAIHHKRAQTIVGQLEPWEKRPH
ncbi:short-chain dehydrogenase [Salirhabdus sp. Marseille-P4669]|uniref:short-chain dehydrogenase n=1 Tax=Salirhabdus sp. Marseille-P4669 TaxID=2042310 RepID=UPI000C7BB50A|nr:short-chain dehydrogenase [Salirhabdus sp. Marseille-P4669]